MQKKSNSKSSPSEEVVNDQGGADNVDKIRDILFGNQMRDFDRKFAQLEQRIGDDFAALKKENALQIESLQGYIDSEIAILDSKLKTSEASSHDELDKLSAQLGKTRQDHDKRLDALGKSLDDQARDINQKILKQTQDFQSEMNSQFELVRKRMDEYRNDLSEGKVDKSSLAEMLNALALQVQGEAGN